MRLLGVVMDNSEPRDRALVIADQTAGIYVLAATNLFSGWRRGDRLEVDGVTDPGEFAPIVLARAVRKQGTAPIPPPRAVTYHQLVTGAMDGQWVELEGVVRRYVPEPGTARMLIAADGGIVPVRITGPLDPRIQEDAEVRVQAMCFYQFNRRRQVLTPVLAVPAGVPVLVQRPAPDDPYAAPVRSADSLFKFTPESPSGHRIHVRGVVTYCQPGSLVWIRDESCGLRIQTQQRERLVPGDDIDVLGFAAFGSSSPVLEHAIWRKVGKAMPPSPLVLTNTEAVVDHEEDLVAIEALLVDIQPGFEGFAFTLNKNGTVFKAILKAPLQQRRQLNLSGRQRGSRRGYLFFDPR